MDIEFGKKGKPVLGDTFEAYDRDTYFRQLLELSTELRKATFKDRVREFSRQEGLRYK
jgi:hypothetical protein